MLNLGILGSQILKAGITPLQRAIQVSGITVRKCLSTSLSLRISWSRNKEWISSGRAFWSQASVLGLAGIELVFFTTACIVLCFRFVTKPVLITHQCFGYCLAARAQCQGLFPPPLSTTPPQQVGWKCWRSWQGTQPRQLTQPDQYHMTTIPRDIVLNN